MTDNDIIKALGICVGIVDGDCTDCPRCTVKDGSSPIPCATKLMKYTYHLINRQQAKIERLEHLLLEVMHFVDKWLDGAELKQDEVNRARAMREKTLQIVEKLEEENDFLKSIDIDKIKAEAVNEVVKQLEAEVESSDKYIREYEDTEKQRYWNIGLRHALKVVKRMVGDSSDKKATSKEG